jgi:hypothetical protein
MDFPTMVRSLIGAPHLLALRPRGPVIRMTDRQALRDLRSGREHQYVGKLSDYLAIDWTVMTGQQFAELLQAAQPQLKPEE